MKLAEQVLNLLAEAKKRNEARRDTGLDVVFPTVKEREEAQKKLDNSDYSYELEAKNGTSLFFKEEEPSYDALEEELDDFFKKNHIKNYHFEGR